jgi:hypothetical protein
MSDRMSLRRAHVVFTLAFASASGLVWPNRLHAQTPPQMGGSPPAAAQGEPPRLNWEFRTEQHWLMTLGAEAVVQLVTAGRRPDVVLSLDPGEADEPVHFGLRIDGRPSGIVLAVSPATSVWSPETFLPIVPVLTPGLKPDPMPADPALVGALTDGRVETIARAAVRLSTEISAHRRAPALHEAAALVLTSLAMRESSRHFDDPRALMTRAAAHLAVADALRGRTSASQPVPPSASIEGRLARAALAALAGRQTEALATIEAMRKLAPPPPVASWLRAIDIRTRLDWRVLPAPATATLLERLQHTRALDARLDGDDAVAFVSSHHAEPVADWSRILLQIGFSVEAGNAYADDAIALELAEAVAVHAIVRGQPPAQGSLVEALNQPPTRGPRTADPARVEVVDWPLWADVLQRHLADALLTVSTHLRTRLGDKQAAAEYEAAIAGPYRSLRLLPFVNGFYNQGEGFAAAMAALHPLWNQPQLVPPHAWLMTLERVVRTRDVIPVAPAGQWFAPVVPLGTVPDDVWWRTHAELGQPVASRIVDLARWRQLAPYKRVLVIDALTLEYAGHIPAAAIERELAPFLDYDVGANQQLAQATASPVQREAAYRRMCDLTVDQCGALARYLVDQERDDQAATVYRRWIDGARDRVMASNNSSWLVDYEFAHDRQAEAWRIATAAARTGSSRGLHTLALLAERTDAADKAEGLLRTIAERYEDETALLSFYLRAEARGERRYAAAAAPIQARLFPQGVERVAVTDFTAGEVPDKGVKVEGPSRRLAFAGLRDGDVLVAVDGYRVRDYQQYLVVSLLSRDAAMRFVYYRNGRYLVAEGRFPQRAIADYLRNWIRPVPRPSSGSRRVGVPPTGG